MADSRRRNFATIVWQESAPDGWRDYLNNLHVPCFISPLHEYDINEDGSTKKPHWHVMLMFKGNKSDKQIRDIFSHVNGVGLEVVESAVGMARYLIHLDNPEKYQYAASGVVSYGGIDYQLFISTCTDKYQAIKDMIIFCEDNQIFSYSKLLVWCMHNKVEWFKVLCDSGTYVLKEYLKSKSWTSNNSQE